MLPSGGAQEVGVGGGGCSTAPPPDSRLPVPGDLGPHDICICSVSSQGKEQIQDLATSLTLTTSQLHLK